LRYLKVVANCKFIENYSYAVIKLVEEENTLVFEKLIKFFYPLESLKLIAYSLKHIARYV